MSLTKEAIEYLIQQGRLDEKIIATEYGTYSTVRLDKLRLPEIEPLKVSTLTGLVDYLKTNFDLITNGLLVHIESPTTVRVLSKLGDREPGERDEYLRAVAILPNNIRFDGYMDTEQFNIMLQSSFVENVHRNLLLKFTGLIKEDNVKQTGDNGISQKVTIKTGISTVGEAEVPNPVILAPYRTFQEIEQVESKFIFRMKDGPMAMLVEGDGKAWQNEAKARIKIYLQEQLEGLNLDIIS